MARIKKSKAPEVMLPSGVSTWWKILAVVFALLFVVAVLWSSFFNKKEVNYQPPSNVVVARVEAGVDDDPSLGDEDAPVVIIEFSDFQCTFCKAFWEETFPLIRDDYIAMGRVRFVYRDAPFPELGHVWSVKAAEAAECADDQKKFWEYHDQIFKNQEFLTSLAKEVRTSDGNGVIVVLTSPSGARKYYDISGVIDQMKKIAGVVGLNRDTFEACLDSGKKLKEVEKDKSDGEKAGVEGTPTFFINGQKITGAQPLEVFQTILHRQLAA